MRCTSEPFAASASSVGVGIGPPNALEAPKPTSSVRMSSTLGAPSGAEIGCGKSGLEFLGRSPDDSIERRVRVGQHGDLGGPAAPLASCAWAEAGFDPSHDPPMALARAALAVEIKSLRRFIFVLTEAAVRRGSLSPPAEATATVARRIWRKADSRQRDVTPPRASRARRFPSADSPALRSPAARPPPFRARRRS